MCFWQLCFFFKQKTAYEMRISNWSSDVCSSDLVEGGAELVGVFPNVNFSKSDFSGYDFTIRGIGTKAISASSDPAVAVSFNNTPLIRNRLFEAEFFDLERVEVLRGPQGTLDRKSTRLNSSH